MAIGHVFTKAMELEVVVGTYDCMIKGFSIDVLAAEEKELRKKYHEKDHSGCVRAVACGGRFLATGSTDEVIKLYDMRRHTEIGSLLQHEGSITCLAFHKDTHLFSAAEDGSICVWKCGGSWDCIHTLNGHKYSVTCISIHPSGKLAISVGRDRTVRTWNLMTGRAAFTLRLPTAADLVAWSPIGDHYIISVEKTIIVYNVESGGVQNTIDVGMQVNTLIFVKDTVLAVGSEHSCIHLFSISSGECLAKLEGHGSRVKGLALSPDGKVLFSASSDGIVKAWEISESLSDSRCISTIDSGSRLTCITVVCPEALLRELKITKESQRPSQKEPSSKKRSSKKKQSRNGKKPQLEISSEGGDPTQTVTEELDQERVHGHMEETESKITKEAVPITSKSLLPAQLESVVVGKELGTKLRKKLTKSARRHLLLKRAEKQLRRTRKGKRSLL